MQTVSLRLLFCPIQELQASPHASPTSDLPSKPVSPVFSYTQSIATPNGLEPSTSAVTGRRSNQLSYEANAPLPGLEPGTLELTALCSAIELKGMVSYLPVTNRRFTASKIFGRFFLALPFLRSAPEVSFTGAGAPPLPFAMSLLWFG